MRPSLAREDHTKMANKQFSDAVREKPSQQDFVKAHSEAQAVLKGGKSLPSDWLALFKYAYLLGAKDARDSSKNPAQIEKVVAIQKSQGANTTMATSNTPTKTDWERMQARLEELNELVQKNIDGTVGIEKLDTAGLVKIIRDVNQPMVKRNRATEVLLAKCGNDPAEFTRLVKG